MKIYRMMDEVYDWFYYDTKKSSITMQTREIPDKLWKDYKRAKNRCEKLEKEIKDIFTPTL